MGRSSQKCSAALAQAWSAHGVAGVLLAAGEGRGVTVAPEVGSTSVSGMEVTVGMSGAARVPDCGARAAVIAFCVSSSATHVATNSVGLGPAAEEVGGGEQAARKMTNEKMINEQ